ncbi:AAA family ATPase [Amycolatopsis magusensis]|uniref:AAA family ATPase n=1 Tax=Amycolatopsis magusensis TaxID=882444 RepID=UPI00378E2A68
MSLAFVIWIHLQRFNDISGYRVSASLKIEELERLFGIEARATVSLFTRSVVNRHLDAEFDSVLTVSHAPGLRDARSFRFVIDTASLRYGADQIRQFDSGAVIITGPRGMGKSALIRHILEEQKNDSPIPEGIFVSVPSLYDARDFILHLHAECCRAVLKHFQPQLRCARTKIAKIIVGGACITADVELITLGFLGNQFPSVDLLTYSAWLVSIGLLVTAASAISAWLNYGGLKRERGRIRRLVRSARTDLQRVRFLRTYTAGWSGKIATGGSDITLTRTRQVTEQSRSFPEVVSDFRAFVRRMTPKGNRLIIAIDDLDKIGDVERTSQFVADVGAILDLPRCVYVTTLSSDAMVAFGRRFSTTKTNIDGAFDLAIDMRPLSLSESSDALAARIVGLSREFRLLAHLMSTGRPRELVRVARKLIDYGRTSSEDVGISEGAQMLTRDLAEENLRAASLATLEASEIDTLTFRRALNSANPGGDIDLFEDMLRRWACDAVDFNWIHWELLSYHSYLCTIRRIFANLKLVKGLLAPMSDRHLLPLLEQASHALGADPMSTWILVNESRDIAGLNRLD